MAPSAFPRYPLAAARRQHIGEGVVFENMVVIEGRHRVQADQGVTDIAQRLVHLLDQPLEIRTGESRAGSSSPKKGMGLPAALSSSQPNSGVRIRKP